jgi:hypothetical protein
VSDERLRELEARWRSTGSEEDELAWIAARARVGERLERASYLRLVSLDPPLAADCLEQATRDDALRSARIRVAARYGHLPAAELLSRDPSLGSSPGHEDPVSPELPFRAAICAVARQGLATTTAAYASEALEVYRAAEVAVEDGAVSWQQAGEALLAFEAIEDGVEVGSYLVEEACNALIYLFQRPDLAAAHLQFGLGEEAFNQAFVAELLAPVFDS